MSQTVWVVVSDTRASDGVEVRAYPSRELAERSAALAAIDSLHHHLLMLENSTWNARRDWEGAFYSYYVWEEAFQFYLEERKEEFIAYMEDRLGQLRESDNLTKEKEEDIYDLVDKILNKWEKREEKGTNDQISPPLKVCARYLKEGDYKSIMELWQDYKSRNSVSDTINIVAMPLDLDLNPQNDEKRIPLVPEQYNIDKSMAELLEEYDIEERIAEILERGGVNGGNAQSS